MLNRQLIKDDRVRFAGYQVRHPLEKDVYFKVQTSEHSYVLVPGSRSCGVLLLCRTDVRSVSCSAGVRVLLRWRACGSMQQPDKGDGGRDFRVAH